jgi:predicted amidophosphoribosyltransferase
VEETPFEESISQPEETEEPLETETEIPQPTEIEIPKTPKYCSVCGTPLQDYAHFCHNCGHSTKE